MFSYVLKSLCLCSLLAAQPLAAAWSSPETISQTGANIPGIAVDSNGNITAIWSTNNNIQTAYKPFLANWQPEETIYSSSQTLLEPQIAFDTNNNALAIWMNENAGSYSLMTAYKPSGNNWQEAKNFSQGAQSSMYPSIAFDPHDNAIAVWMYFTPSSRTIQAANKPSGGDWEAAETISPAGENSSLPHIAFDPNGNAIAVWVISVGGSYKIQAANKPSGGNWQPAETISSFSVESSPQIAFAPNGDATAMWEGPVNLRTAYKPSGGDWQPEEKFNPAPNGSIMSQIAFDANGNATAMWAFMDPFTSTFIIQTSYKPSGGDWQPAETISLANESSRHPKLAVDSNGNATAVWTVLYLPSGIKILKSSTNIRYIPPIPAPLPPCKFRGCLHKKKDAHKRHYHLKAKWTPSTSPNIKKYRIYKHSKIVRVVKPNNKLKYKTHLYWRSSIRKFKITSINTDNVESKRKRLKVKCER